MSNIIIDKKAPKKKNAIEEHSRLAMTQVRIHLHCPMMA